MLLIIGTILACVAAHPQVTVDPNLIADIFGTPPTKAPDGKERLEDITVKPTQGPVYLQDKEGVKCQCVPYYLCDKDLNGVQINDSSITGWGMLDIRFGEEDCQESVERCCTTPREPDQVPIPKPDPNKPSGCGYSNPNGLDFQVTGGNGNEAQFGEFPWVVALLDALNGSYVGVGVLIHPQVVMTAAHIAYRYGPQSLLIRAGEWDTQTTKERLQSQERIVSEIIIRPDFQAASVQNDLALLRLESPVELADHINVICMPSTEEEFETSKNCVANGWGKDVFGQAGRYAVILKKVEINMVPHATCNAALQETRLSRYFKLHKSFVCAGGSPGKDTCTGDGGAPLVCPFQQNRFKLTGLVAWGIGCGNNIPAVYARVSLFRNWVDKTMLKWGYDISGYTV
ncbi:unnamed protein product [Pieris macdunnoughi]|uniref:Phenoloxidase-activating factor 2 n=1 Tax=Pieris macdunnoughi TaxID=345717 RepID=A0A821X6N8_9NEOP|nr:unnamed protein product [Pieris macdunnoughi]